MKKFREDVAYTHEVNGARTSLLIGWLSPSIRCATYMRIAAKGGVIGRLMRGYLLRAYACDVSPGAQIGGGLMLPHPTGVVIGRGAVLRGRVHVYQGVTIGANSRSEYPIIDEGVKLFPNSMVTGKVRVHAGAVLGAGAIVYDDVAPGEVVKGPRSLTESASKK